MKDYNNNRQLMLSHMKFLRCPMKKGVHSFQKRMMVEGEMFDKRRVEQVKRIEALDRLFRSLGESSILLEDIMARRFKKTETQDPDKLDFIDEKLRVLVKKLKQKHSLSGKLVSTLLI